MPRCCSLAHARLFAARSGGRHRLGHLPISCPLELDGIVALISAGRFLLRLYRDTGNAL